MADHCSHYALVWLPGPYADVNFYFFLDSGIFSVDGFYYFHHFGPEFEVRNLSTMLFSVCFLFITLCLIYALIKFLFNHRSSFYFVVFMATICYGVRYSCDSSGYEASGISSFTLLWRRTYFMHMAMTATSWLGKIKEVPAISASSGATYGSGPGHSYCENF